MVEGLELEHFGGVPAAVRAFRAEGIPVLGSALIVDALAHHFGLRELIPGQQLVDRENARAQAPRPERIFLREQVVAHRLGVQPGFVLRVGFREPEDVLVTPLLRLEYVLRHVAVRHSLGELTHLVRGAVAEVGERVSKRLGDRGPAVGKVELLPVKSVLEK